MKTFPSKPSWLLQKNSRYREKLYQIFRKIHRHQQSRKKAKRKRFVALKIITFFVRVHLVDSKLA